MVRSSVSRGSIGALVLGADMTISSMSGGQRSGAEPSLFASGLAKYVPQRQR